MQTVREADTGEDLQDQGFGTSLSCVVRCEYHFCPLSEIVHHYYYETIILPWLGQLYHAGMLHVFHVFDHVHLMERNAMRGLSNQCCSISIHAVWVTLNDFCPS